MNIKIVSGGQMGVDQGALEAAAQLGLEFGGWAPARWLAEKPLGAIPEAYRGAMREYPDQGSNAQNYRERTKANVRGECEGGCACVAQAVSGDVVGARSQRGRSARVQVARNTGEDEGVSI